MAETAPELKQVIQRYRAELARMGIGVERILLFGSWARAAAEEGSDIDLVVVSADFASFSQRERLEKLGIAAARILEPIQAQGFTPEEIARGQLLPFWQQVVQEQAVVV